MNKEEPSIVYTVELKPSTITAGSSSSSLIEALKTVTELSEKYTYSPVVLTHPDGTEYTYINGILWHGY